MTIWNLSQAKARFSEMIDSARPHPQLVRKRGKDVAVVLSADEYERLRSTAERARPGRLAAFLEFTEELKREGDLAISLPRRRAQRRPSPFSD